MLPLSQLDPRSLKTFRHLFAKVRRLWHHVLRTAHRSRRVATTRKSLATPSGASEVFSRCCRRRGSGAYLHSPESETISLTWKKRRPCGVPSSLLALASRLSSR